MYLNLSNKIYSLLLYLQYVVYFIDNKLVNSTIIRLTAERISTIR